MSEARSSILLYSEDTGLRERVSSALEREIDVRVEARREPDELSTLGESDYAAAIVDTGDDARPRDDLISCLPENVPVLALMADPTAVDWLQECRPTGEALGRDAPDSHIIHALRLSLVRTIQRQNQFGDVEQGPDRSRSTEVATRSVLGDLRTDFLSDLFVVIRDCEEALRRYAEAADPARAVASETVVPASSNKEAPATDPGVGALVDGDSLPPINLLIDRVRKLRKLSDTLDLAEYAPLMFALEVSLRDLPGPEGRDRIRDLLRQLRNIASGRPAAAGLEGRRIRVALVGASPEEAHAIGLEDPDRLDVRPFRDIRRFARQIDLFRPDVVAIRVSESDEQAGLVALQELRGGTSETVIALCSHETSMDPITALRFPRFALFAEPFDWHEVSTRIFEFEGDLDRLSSVMIVHDTDHVVRDIEHCLDPESFVIHSVNSTSQVIETLRRRGPDLVILGDELERMSGFDVCREIRAELPLARIPIIIVSARPDRPGREQAFHVGADDYIGLPLIPGEIRRRAGNLIEFRRLRYDATARDSLTGLRDACTLIDHLGEALEEAAERGEWVSLLALDIDRYSMIRNFYGLASANTIVRSVADALRKIFDHDDLIFRGTDDEFFVIRRKALRDESEREKVFEGIADIGKLTFRSADGRGFYATVTGGHVVIPPERITVDSCVRRTMRVLSAAKKMARGKIMSAEIDPDF